MPKNIYVSIDYSRAVPLRYTVYCAEQTDADYANGRKGLRADELSELALRVEGNDSVASTNVLLVYKAACQIMTYNTNLSKDIYLLMKMLGTVR